MRRSLIPLLALVAAMAALATSASATTAPTLTVKIEVVMTDHGVTLSQKRSYRGWDAHFIVVNQGKKAHKFEIGGLSTPVLAPGKSKTLKVELALRGTVTYDDALNDGKRSKGTFTVI